jgi:hypothetical protein
MHLRNWMSSALLLLGAIGCNNSSPAPIASDLTGVEAIEQADSDVIEAQIHADIASWEEIQKWVSAQRGKVVVIDIWSTS